MAKRFILSTASLVLLVDKMPSRPLEVIHLGRMRYGEALQIMEERAQSRIKDQVPDALLLVEHEPVFTLGRRAEASNILASQELLKQYGIDVFEAGRGGDVTYHGPGQIVGYPIIDLKPERKDVRRYVADLEQLMIDVSARFGIEAGRQEGLIGTWIDGRRKIGAIGVRITKWVTTHGFALNVNPNMAHFRLIVPCGISDKAVTSISDELGKTVTLEEVMPVVEEIFLEKFSGRTIQE